MWSSQEMVEATEMDIPFSLICLESCALDIVLLYSHSPKELHPVEKSSRIGSFKSLETESRVASFCTSLSGNCSVHKKYGPNISVSDKAHQHINVGDLCRDSNTVSGSQESQNRQFCLFTAPCNEKMHL